MTEIVVGLCTDKCCKPLGPGTGLKVGPIGPDTSPAVQSAIRPLETLDQMAVHRYLFNNEDAAPVP